MHKNSKHCVFCQILNSNIKKIALNVFDLLSIENEHKAWLKDPQRGKRADFKNNKTLKQLSFKNMVLDQAEFQDANLSGSTFKNASLKKQNLKILILIMLIVQMLFLLEQTLTKLISRML
jgi:uncharacterized protein YjbI with pentapeptide repeats